MSTGAVMEELDLLFAEWKWCGLILPDGWFGRPYDNHYVMHKLEVATRGIRIEFFGGDELVISGALKLEKIRGGVVLAGVERASWAWATSLEERSLIEFTSGPVILVSPNGMFSGVEGYE